MPDQNPEQNVDSQLAPGSQVAGRYRIKEVAALGRLGIVYKAHDATLSADVALKVVEPTLLPSSEARQNFVQQFGRLRGLQHRNIVRLLDLAVFEDQCILAYQLVEGLSLRRVMQMRAKKGQRFSAHEVRPIVMQIASGLSAAHLATAVHGVLSAEDLLLLPDHLKITGIGYFPLLPLRGTRELLEASSCLLAPEVHGEKGPPDPRTDVFGLGALLYELVLAEPATLDMRKSVGVLRNSWPAVLDDIIAKAMHKDPDHRYPRVADFAMDLQAALGPQASAKGKQTKPLGSTRPPPPPLARETSRRATAPMMQGTPAPEPQPASQSAEIAAVVPPSEADATVVMDTGSLHLVDVDVTAAIVTSPNLPLNGVASLAKPLPDSGVSEEDRQTAYLPSRTASVTPRLPRGNSRTPTPTRTPTPIRTPPPGSLKAPTPIQGVPVKTSTPPLGRSASSSVRIPVAAPYSTLRVALMVSVPILVVGLAFVFVVKARNDERQRRTEEQNRAVEELRRQVEELRRQNRLAEVERATPPPAPVVTQPITPTVEVSSPALPQPSVMPLPPTPAPKPKTQVDRPTTATPKPMPEQEPESLNAPGCPPTMRLVATKKTNEVVQEGYCIDAYEYPGSGSMPHTTISWDGARQLCEARGARLCTSHEWERACFGKGGAAYPYGDEWDAAKCNTQTEEGTERNVIATGSNRACKSAWGVYDMSGNVAEWVQEKVVRGGSANKPDYATQCSSQSAGSASGFVGFRCCADLRH